MIRDLMIVPWPIWLVLVGVAAFTVALCRAAALGDEQLAGARTCGMSEFEARAAVRPWPAPIEVELLGGTATAVVGTSVPTVAVSSFLDPGLFDDRRSEAQVLARHLTGRFEASAVPGRDLAADQEPSPRSLSSIVAAAPPKRSDHAPAAGGMSVPPARRARRWLPWPASKRGELLLVLVVGVFEVGAIAGLAAAFAEAGLL